MPGSAARRQQYRSGYASLNGTIGPLTHTRASTTLTVDTNGNYQQNAIDAPAFDAAGLRVTHSLKNKSECYGVPRADAYGATLNSGTATKGKVYEIVVRTGVDWSAVGTLLSGTANTAGAKYVITGALTFDADDTGKEVYDYVGTKAYHDGTTFQNPITGMTLSGDVAAVLSIATDQTALDTFKISNVCNGYKIYDVTTGAGGTGVIIISGAMAAVTTSYAIQIRVLSGSVSVTDSQSGNAIAPAPSGAAYARYKKENFTATAGRTVRITVAASSQIRFLLHEHYESTICPKYPIVSAGAAGGTTRAQTTAYEPLAPNFRQDSFMVTCEWTPDFSLADLPNSTNIPIVTLSTGVANNLLYFAKDGAGAGALSSYDGTNTATVALTPVAGTTYKCGVRGNTAGNEMMVSLNGTNGTATSYDGAVVVDGGNKIYLQGITGGASIKNLRITTDRGAAALAAATT